MSLTPNLETLLTSVLVLLAVVYAVWYWLPKAWRAYLGRLSPKLAQAPSCGACESACDSCGSVSKIKSTGRTELTAPLNPLYPINPINPDLPALGQRLEGPSTGSPASQKAIWMRPE